MLGDFVNREVLLTGEVVQFDGHTIVLKCSDGNEAKVVTNDKNDISSRFVEVCGRVLDGSQIEEVSRTALTENFDMDSYEQLVQMSNGTYRNIFRTA